MTGNGLIDTSSDAELAALAGPVRLAFFTPLHENLSLADRKATFILGTVGLLMTVMLFFLQSIVALAKSPWAPGRILFVAGLIVLIALFAQAARLAYRGFVAPFPPVPGSLAYFRNIVAHSRDAYHGAMASLDHKAALAAVLEYNYSCSLLSAAKFRAVNGALRCIRVAILLWMLLLAVIAAYG
jgi:hypothetical protein